MEEGVTEGWSMEGAEMVGEAKVTGYGNIGRRNQWENADRQKSQFERDLKHLFKLTSYEQ